jgi:formate dehydrogenase subunit gamma
MEEAREASIVTELLAHTAPQQDRLLPLLFDVQRRLGRIPDTCVAPIARHFNLSRADVHGVASFYHDLRETRAGAHVVQVCQAEACQALGGRALTAHAQRRLGIDLGSTTADRLVTLAPAYCFGNCACGPTVRIGDDVYGRVTPQRFDELLDALPA